MFSRKSGFRSFVTRIFERRPRYRTSSIGSSTSGDSRASSSSDVNKRATSTTGPILFSADSQEDDLALLMSSKREAWFTASQSKGSEKQTNRSIVEGTERKHTNGQVCKKPKYSQTSSFGAVRRNMKKVSKTVKKTASKLKSRRMVNLDSLTAAEVMQREVAFVPLQDDPLLSFDQKGSSEEVVFHSLLTRSEDEQYSGLSRDSDGTQDIKRRAWFNQAVLSFSDPPEFTGDYDAHNADLYPMEGGRHFNIESTWSFPIGQFRHLTQEPINGEEKNVDDTLLDTNERRITFGIDVLDQGSKQFVHHMYHDDCSNHEAVSDTMWI